MRVASRIWIGIFLLVSIAAAPAARAWGERGHQLIGTLASLQIAKLAPADSGGALLAKFFADRSLALGHLSNIPDISWRDPSRKRIAAMNSPGHYFGPERLLGVPGADFPAFLDSIRNLPPDYAEIKRKYDGTPNALPGVPPQSKLLHTYETLGTTPWRAEQLYELLVKALACAKGKETEVPSGSPGFSPPFQIPSDGTADTVEPPLPSYLCQFSTSRSSDLYAASVIAGILSHFIGDQSQPYHPTADYDGWVTGNGGIHGYFESDVVSALDQGLSLAVQELAADPKFSTSVWGRVGTDLGVDHGAARLLIFMAADAQAHKAELAQLDDQHAILVKSSALPWGDYPQNHAPGTLVYAKRRPADTPAILVAMKPLVVERMATSVVVLARIWMAAWEAAGKPKMDVSSFSTPYPLDSPFLWPDFDRDALARAKPKTSSVASGFRQSSGCVHLH